jgi:hypothetical protein
MGLDYDLNLATNLDEKQVLEMLVGRIPGMQWGDDGSFLVDPIATVTPTVLRASTRRLYEDAFHFVPTLGVGFRFVSYADDDADSDSDYDRFRQLMLQATILLLEHAPDAVLLFNGETIVLSWFGGKLVLNSDYHIFEDDDWLRNRLSLPFERRPLPSPWK